MSSSPAGCRKCSVCGLVKEPLELKLCSRCKEPNYLVCSKECQARDWKEHKKHCNTPTAPRPPPLPVSQGILRTMTPGNVVFQPVCDPGDKLCFVYSRGLFNEGLPELLAIDIPIEKMDIVMNLLGGLVGKCRIPNKVFHGYKLEADNYWMVTFNIKDERQRQQLITSMGIVDLSAQVRLVKPLWDTWESLSPPNIRQEQILGKWRQYRQDHPPPSRFAPASALLEQALLGTEWKKYLTPKQVKHVLENREYMLRMGFTELCFPPMGKADLFISDVANSIHLAPQRYRRGIKVAQGNYSWDIN